MEQINEQVQLKGGFITDDPRLDRVPHFDERSRDYPVTAVINASKPRSYTWGCDIVLDQGREGACVGFSVAHELRAKPVVIPAVSTTLAMSIYKRAQFLDPWPGEQYSGTSVLAGVKAAQELGHFDEYRWAFGVDDLALAVSRKGPAILGIDWYDSMYRPQLGELNGKQVAMLPVTGSIVGGHAIMCAGYSPKTRTFVLHNSWGPRWGINGRALITYDDMGALLAAGGEACILVKR